MAEFARLVSKIRWRRCCYYPIVRYQGLKTSASVHDLKRLVILGSGWGGYSLLKSIDKKIFKATVVSPRNHFLFTPLLASTTVGESLSLRAVLQVHARVTVRA